MTDAARSEAGGRVPVTVLGGYLGAGKTTLLRSLLTADHGLRIAVIVNDFGELSIDSALIADSSADRIELANGCACCQAGDALAEAFFTLAEHDPPYDRIVVEASGVADPAKVAGWASLPGLRLDGIVVLADATTIGEQVHDRYVGDIVRHQLACADLVVLSKTDLTDATGAADARRVVMVAASTATIIESAASPPIAALFDLDRIGIAPQPTSHAERFVSMVWRGDGPLDTEALTSLLRNTAGLVRAKGFVRSGDGAVLVQAVGTRVSLHPWEAATPIAPTLVLIGLRDQFDSESLAARLDALNGR